MSDKLQKVFAVLCALCLIMGILGGVATWDIVKRLNVESSVQGTVVSEESIVERETVYDFDNAELFFRFTPDEAVWLQQGAVYYVEYQFDKLNYDAANRRYATFINDIEGRGTNYHSSIDSYFDLQFRSPQGAITELPLLVRASFYADKTMLRLEIATSHKDKIGYLNKMMSLGMRIEIYESTSVPLLPDIDDMPKQDYGISFNTPNTNVVIDLTGITGTLFLLSINEVNDSPYYLSDARIAGYPNYNYLNLFAAAKRKDFVLQRLMIDKPLNAIQIQAGGVEILTLDYFTKYLAVLVLPNRHAGTSTFVTLGENQTASLESSVIDVFAIKDSYYFALNNLGAENANTKLIKNTVYIKFMVI